jgi:hypothetical protein
MSTDHTLVEHEQETFSITQANLSKMFSKSGGQFHLIFHNAFLLITVLKKIGMQNI